MVLVYKDIQRYTNLGCYVLYCVLVCYPRYTSKTLLATDSGWIWSHVENWLITSVPYSKLGPIAQGPVLDPVLGLVPVPLVFTHKHPKLVRLVKPALHLVRVVRRRVMVGVVLVGRPNKVESFHWRT